MKDDPPLRRANLIGFDIELRAIRNHGRRWPAHWHADLQLIATVAGHGTAVVNGETIDLPLGSVLAIPPCAVYTAHEAKPGAGWTFLSLHVEPEHLAGLTGTWAPVIARRGSPLAKAFKNLASALFERHCGDPVGAWRDVIACLKSGARTLRTNTISPALLRARDRLADGQARALWIQAIAAAHGFERRSFERQFRHAFHLSPSTWKIIARVEIAKRAMRAGCSAQRRRGAPATAICGISAGSIDS